MFLCGDDDRQDDNGGDDVDGCSGVDRGGANGDDDSDIGGSGDCDRNVFFLKIKNQILTFIIDF